MKRLIILFLILIVSLATQADSTLVDTNTTIETNSLKLDDPSLILKISRMQVNNMELFDTLYVSLKSDGTPIAGFDFKIGFNSQLIDIVDILPGEIYDSCQWEYFNAHRISTLEKENSPVVLWQTVALAEVIPDQVRPLCFGFEREASLLKIILSNAHVMEMPDTVIPIYFYWEDCTDNTISGQTGTILMISKHVRDYFGTQDKDETAIFPNRTGAPQQCVDPGLANKPLRLIEFHNGGVEFEFKIDLKLPDSTLSDSI